MNKVKATLIFTFLAITSFCAITLLANPAFARHVLTSEEKKKFAQNSILFYVPCDTQSECEPDADVTYDEITPIEDPPEEGEEPESENPGIPESPEDPTSPEEPVIATGNCACPNGCGRQNASGMESQNDGHDTYRSLLWKGGGDKDVQTSGCSLVAVVNAATALGVSTSITSVANWSYPQFRNVSAASWAGTVQSIVDHLDLEITATLFDNVHNVNPARSTSAKLALIKQALASGKMVVASGEVTEVGTHGFKHCANRASLHGIETSTFANQGNCIFSPNGHYVAIVGVTSSNKLIVANPALGSRSATGWAFPADNVLQYADIAKAIGKKGSGGLISCSEN